MFGLIIALIINTAIIGAIVAYIERESIEWPRLLACVVAITLTTHFVSDALPGAWSLLGIVAGALVGAVAISGFCGMEIKRAAMAATIFFGVQIVLSVALLALIFLSGTL